LPVIDDTKAVFHLSEFARQRPSGQQNRRAGSPSFQVEVGQVTQIGGIGGVVASQGLLMQT
jgi:hypothetical protein